MLLSEMYVCVCARCTRGYMQGAPWGKEERDWVTHAYWGGGLGVHGQETTLIVVI